MKMRNVFLSSAFLLCVGFVACNDTPELPEVPVSLFTVCASMPEATRTSLGETTANGYKTTWMAGDAIGLFSDTDPSVNRMLVTYQSAPSVTFSGVGAVAGNEYFAYYPYSPDVTFSDGVFSLEMPSEQRCTDDDHLLEYVPMVARSRTADQLHFAHCCGMVRLQLLGNATIEKVVFETLDGRPLCGTLHVTTSVNGDIHTELVGGGSSVTLCGLSKTLSDRRVSSFLIAVPEGEYHGIRFSIQDSEKNVMNLQASDFTMQVHRSHILSIPPAVYAPTERIYEVGDLYDDGAMRGIVFEVDASGEHGKIVSLDETSGFFGGGRNVLNLGFGWDRTPNVLWRLKNGHFVNQKPRAVVLNIGTNNLTKTVHYPGDSPEDAADGILAVIDLLQELSPESRIVSMAVFPRGGRGEELERKVMQMNAIVTERLKGRRNILRLDLTDRFLNPDGSQRKEFFRDGCHLTCAGYEIWGEALRPILDSCAPRLTKGTGFDAGA